MARVVANTKDMPHEEWLALRKHGIGGSDAAKVLGVSKYGSQLTAYMEKKGMYTPKVSEATEEAARWGTIMEPVLRDEFRKRINEERAEQGLPPVRVEERHFLYAHEQFDFMRTNLDGVVLDHENGSGILEIKTASEYLKEEWEGEDIPNQYMIQVQHNIKVVEADFAYVVALIGGNKYKHYYIERDDELISHIVQGEHYFWNNHFLANIPPTASDSDAETEMMKILYPRSYDDPVLELPLEFKELAERYEDYKEQQKTLKKLETDAKNKLMAAMQESGIAFAGPHQITWRANKNGVKSFRVKLNKREAQKA